jgi:large subunit ribosomal protein L17
MRHNVDGRKLGRTTSHRRALYRNLVIALITHERIRTTTPKAKEARRLAERLITFAKRGDLSARRHVATILHDKDAVRKLFDVLGPRYSSRPGGYTRVLKFAKPRAGDNADMALLELIPAAEAPKAKKKASSKKASAKKKSAANKAAAKQKAAPKKKTAAKKKASAKKSASKKKASGTATDEG